MSTDAPDEAEQDRIEWLNSPHTKRMREGLEELRQSLIRKLCLAAATSTDSALFRIAVQLQETDKNVALHGGDYMVFPPGSQR